MPDNSKDNIAVPNKPPKDLPRDYSSRPQRPITLKQREKKPAPAQHKPPSKSPQRKSRSSTKEKSPNPWHLEVLSEKAKATIVAGADRDGVSIAEYLEQLVLHQTTEPPPTRPHELDAQIVNRIFALEQRLERLEEQRGFWGSFWDRVINPKN